MRARVARPPAPIHPRYSLLGFRVTVDLPLAPTHGGLNTASSYLRTRKRCNALGNTQCVMVEFAQWGTPDRAISSDSRRSGSARWRTRSALCRTGKNRVRALGDARPGDLFRFSQERFCAVAHAQRFVSDGGRGSSRGRAWRPLDATQQSASRASAGRPAGRPAVDCIPYR